MQKQEVVKHVNCVKCGKKNATKDDQLCDGCRFELALDNMIRTRE